MRLMWSRVWTTAANVVLSLVGQYERAIIFKQYPSHAAEGRVWPFVRSVFDYCVTVVRGERLMGIVSFGCSIPAKSTTATVCERSAGSKYSVERFRIRNGAFPCASRQ